MKKIISFIFAVIMTVPVLTGAYATTDCKKQIENKYGLLYKFKSDPEYIQVYNELQAAENVKLQQWKERVRDSDSNGNCNSVPFKCTAGQKNMDCVPEPCWELMAHIKTDLFLDRDAEEEFKNRKIKECEATSSGQSTPSAPEGTTTMTATVTPPPPPTNDPSNGKPRSTPSVPDTPSTPAKPDTPMKSTPAPTPTPAPSNEKITITGMVSDAYGELAGASITVKDTKPPVGTTTGMDGKFTLPNVPKNATIVISFIGNKSVELPATGDFSNITMQEDSKQLDEVVVTACAPSTRTAGIKTNVYDNTVKQCVPTSCDEPRYVLVNVTDKCFDAENELDDDASKDTSNSCHFVNAVCEDQVGKDCTCTDTNATECKYEWENNTLTCAIKKCNKDKKYVYNEQTKTCELSEGPCPDDKLKAIEHATAGQLTKGNCIPTECEDGFEVSGNQCVELSGGCSPMPDGAKKAHREWDADAKAEVCIIDECKDKACKISQDGKSCNCPKLSKEDSEKKIAELRNNAQKMKDKEQSLENKMLGAAGIASVSQGAMAALSAKSEQSADEAAERDMQAYLETFRCEYGDGKNFKGGDMNIELPASHDLLPYYNEYMELATTLKETKSALNMSPGIESETVFDKATTGLYDDVGIGKTGGAFTSLSRALMDPTGKDAEKWAAQKADTADKLKKGTTLALGGAALTAVANIAINGKNKNKSDEIENKYKQLYKLEEEINTIPPETAPCPSGATGSGRPNCDCGTTGIYNSDSNTCEPCGANQRAENGQCVPDCPADKPYLNTVTNECFAVEQPAPAPTCTYTCAEPSDSNHLTRNSDGCKCDCSNGYKYDTATNTCTCTTTAANTTAKEENGQCIMVETRDNTTIITTTTDNATLNNSSLFKIGKSDLQPAAKTKLEGFITEWKTNNYKNCVITIDGYTDPVGSDATNDRLSKERADAVRAIFDAAKTSNTELITSVTATGHGETNCTCGLGKNATNKTPAADYNACNGKPDTHNLTGSARYAPCRRIELKVTCQQTTTVTQTASDSE